MSVVLVRRLSRFDVGGGGRFLAFPLVLTRGGVLDASVFVALVDDGDLVESHRASAAVAHDLAQLVVRRARVGELSLEGFDQVARGRVLLLLLLLRRRSS